VEMINEDRLFISKSLQGKIGPEQLVDPAADDILNIMVSENTILEKNVKGAQWSCKANTFSEDNYDVSILIVKAPKRKNKNVKR
jgi:hypothetical protein